MSLVTLCYIIPPTGSTPAAPIANETADHVTQQQVDHVTQQQVEQLQQYARDQEQYYQQYIAQLQTWSVHCKGRVAREGEEKGRVSGACGRICGFSFLFRTAVINVAVQDFFHLCLLGNFRLYFEE